MATFVKYEPFIERLANKEIDMFGTTDTFKAVIHTDAPVAATDDDLADLTQIGGSNGYTTGGEDTQNDATRSGGTVTGTCVDITWTATGGNLGASTTGRYVSIYDDTHASDALINSYDYGATFTVASGESFTVDFGASYFTLA